MVVSAPSGGGKTTLCRRLLAEDPRFTYSISCTTRPPRPGEVDGRDYHFLTPAAFQERLAAGGFLEWATVHGNLYGTPAAPIVEALTAGRDVMLDIDVQGAAQILARIAAEPPASLLRRAYTDVFILPPSVDELRRRLERRGQDAPEVIDRRVRQAEAEMAHAGEYQHRIVNDVLEDAYRRLTEFVRSERMK
jgi:guanylate kinase